MYLNQLNTLRFKQSKCDRIRLLVTISPQALAAVAASQKYHLLHHSQEILCCGHSYSFACTQLLQSHLIHILSAQLQPKSLLHRELYLFKKNYNENWGDTFSVAGLCHGCFVFSQRRAEPSDVLKSHNCAKLDQVFIYKAAIRLF